MANGNLSPTTVAFADQFQAIVPLMLAEWPQLNRDDLLATNGNLDQTVAYIAQQTEHTQTLIRRHLDELTSLAIPPTVASVSAAPKPAGETIPSSIDQLLEDLESRTERLMREFKAEMLPDLEKKARSNLGMSLLMALGLGVILGLLLGGKRG